MQAFMAKRALQSYRDAEREIDNQIERLQVLQERIMSVGSPEISDMPRNPSPIGDRMAEMVAIIGEEEARLEQMKSSAREKRKVLADIITKISGRSGPDKRAVIALRYIDNQRWERVTEALFGCCDDFDEKRDSYERRIFNLHKYALRDIDRIIINDGYIEKLKACGCL